MTIARLASSLLTGDSSVSAMSSFMSCFPRSALTFLTSRSKRSSLCSWVLVVFLAAMCHLDFITPSRISSPMGVRRLHLGHSGGNDLAFIAILRPHGHVYGAPGRSMTGESL